MKDNGPVTKNEVKMKDSSILVSKTDLKGRITFCNQDFIDISGFNYDELLGKSHNVVRHPDMPAPLFKQLWDDLKSDKPWTAAVKNRAKNGDYYWVKANVSPIYKEGKIVEYMSVRTKPTEQEVRQAEVLYKQISHGEVVVEQTGFAKLVENFKAVSSFSLQYLAVLIVSVMMFTMSGLLFAGVDGVFVAQIMLLFAIGFLVSGFIFVKKSQALINYLHEKIINVSRGDYFSWTNIQRSDDIGRVLKALFTLQVRLGFEVIDASERATAGQRIQSALDNATSNVMLVDNDYSIIYVNNTLTQTLTHAQQDLRKANPNFDSHRLIGASLDDFYDNAPQHRQTLSALTTTHVEERTYGDSTMKITSNPVISNGVRIGTVVEWNDLTVERKLEDEIESLVSAAQSGDLSKRIDVNSRSGFFKTLSSNLNDMLDVLEATFSDVNVILKGVSDGELGETLDRAYKGVFGEVKDNLNSTITQLRNIVEGIRSSASQINGSSLEIASGNNNLSNRTEQQSASLEEVASSMEEITSTVKQNAENAKQANQLAGDAGDTADQGGKVVANAINAMEEINQSSGKIAEIISVIDEIAFQTNLLALNASVEAARAGEQGRGFAVVATEVRNLAQRSATAAKEIKELIQDSVKKVQTGSDLVNESGETLGNIVLGVKKVKDIVGEIASASNDQSSSIQQVSIALSGLEDMTQQNAALAEQASAASTHMTEQANTMDKQVGFFKTEIKV